MRPTRGVLLWALALPGLVTACVAPPARLVLTSPQQQSVAAAQAYLEGLRRFRASFVQQGWLGPGAGTLWVDRPGRLRMRYQGPRARDITASQGVFVVVDQGTGSVSTTRLSSTPLGLLLGEHLAFSGGVAITGLEDDPTALEVTLLDAAHPARGTLTLRLAKMPWLLTKITATDLRGRSFSLDLSGLTRDPVLTPDLFTPVLP